MKTFPFRGNVESLPVDTKKHGNSKRNKAIEKARKVGNKEYGKKKR